jgi:hypothetical protein
MIIAKQCIALCTVGPELSPAYCRLAGHRHRDQCRRHRYSGTQHLIPVLEHSCTRLGSLIPVPDCFRHLYFYSFRYRSDWMPYSPPFCHLKRLHQGGEGYTLHVYSAGGKEDTPFTSIQQRRTEIYHCTSHCLQRRWIHHACPH